jgi:hypothetical protein
VTVAKKKPDKSAGEYTQEERDRWCYRTAAEMLAINRRADARSKNDAQREESADSTDPSKADWVDTSGLFNK